MSNIRQLPIETYMNRIKRGKYRFRILVLPELNKIEWIADIVQKVYKAKILDLGCLCYDVFGFQKFHAPFKAQKIY